MKTLIIILLLITTSKAYYPIGTANYIAHSTASMVLTVGFHELWAKVPGMDKPNRVVLSFMSALAVGVGKEVYDYSTGGKFDMVDVGFDALGCGLGVGFILTF